MAKDFNDAMQKDLEIARKARRRANGPEWRVAETLGQIADTLIQIRWELADLRATGRGG